MQRWCATTAPELHLELAPPGCPRCQQHQRGEPTVKQSDSGSGSSGSGSGSAASSGSSSGSSSAASSGSAASSSGGGRSP